MLPRICAACRLLDKVFAAVREVVARSKQVGGEPAGNP
jgi:hypothetical protein